jgi:porphobilinogen deaminase
VRELAASCHTPVGVHANGVTIRGFAGLPDGSEWIVDEVALGGDEVAAARGDDEVVAAGGEIVAAGGDATAARFEAAGRELSRRMLAAGAGDLLRAAEAMAAR